MRGALILLSLAFSAQAGTGVRAALQEATARSDQRAGPDEGVQAAAERSRAWVAAFNTGDAVLMERFAQGEFAADRLRRRTPGERAVAYRRMRGGLGALTVEPVGLAGSSAALTVGDERGSRAGAVVRFEERPPFGIIGVQTEAGGASADRAATAAGATRARLVIPRGAARAQVVAAIDGYVSRLAAADRFAGSILVADADQILFERAYGPANRAYGVPNRTTTRFDLGSITKDFTKVAIGQLAQEGRIDLDAPIGRYLADYPNREVAAGVTVRQLVEHTSGLGDVVGPAFFATNMGRLRKVTDFIPMHAAEAPAFTPGTSRRYSNYGYALLGAIIERVSGQPYQDYVQEHVFGPAGMRGSMFPLSDRPVPDLARGYIRLASPEPGGIAYRDNSQIKPLRGMSYGGSFSTARDLLAFASALRGGRLLDARWTHWFFTGVLTAPGVSVGVTERAYDMAAAGGSPGVSASLVVVGGLTVVVLCNMDPPVAEDVGEGALVPALRAWRGG